MGADRQQNHGEFMSGLLPANHTTPLNSAGGRRLDTAKAASSNLARRTISLWRLCVTTPPGAILLWRMSPLLAHRVISLPRSNSVAFGAKRTLSRSQSRIYEYTS
jgi:hypothetical protein